MILCLFFLFLCMPHLDETLLKITQVVYFNDALCCCLIEISLNIFNFRSVTNLQCFLFHNISILLKKIYVSSDVYLSFQQVGRSLFCLGLLIRYGSPLLDMSAFNPRNMDVASNITLFKKYLQAEDFIIKVRALQVLP